MVERAQSQTPEQYIHSLNQNICFTVYNQDIQKEIN